MFVANPVSPLKETPTTPDRLSRKSVAIFLLFGLTMMTLGLGREYRVLTAHEIINVQPAREMIQSGDWIVPKIGGYPIREAKGPLTIWIIAVGMLITGSEAEWVGRVIAIIASLLTSWTMASLAARWYGNRIGLLVGLMQVTMLYVLKIGRLAECDPFLMVSVVAAMSCFARACVDSPQGRNASVWLNVGFFAAIGISFLFKTFVGPVLIFLSCFSYIGIRREWSLLRFFLSPLGWFLLLALTLTWPIVYQLNHPHFITYLQEHYLSRVSGNLGGVKPFYHYALALPLMMLPWFPFCVLALWYGWRHGLFKQPLWQFILAWVIPGVLLFSCSSCKYDHYLAPLLPPLTIISALGLCHYLAWRYNGARSGYVWLSLLTLTMFGVGVGCLLWLKPLGYIPTVWLTTLMGIGCLVLLALEYQRLLAAHITSLFTLVWLGVVVVFVWVMPYHDNYRPHLAFIEHVNKEVPQGKSIHISYLNHQQHLYYLTPRIEIIGNTAPMDDRLKQNDGEMYFLAPELSFKQYQHLGEIEVLDTCPSHSMLPDRYRPVFFRLKAAND